LIWGLAFVAQRVGGEYLPTFMFNGLRFSLGTISLIPVFIIYNIKGKRDVTDRHKTWRGTLPGGLITGVVLFIAISLQQYGIKFTTAGKAGFITDLYIVLVPLLGIFLGQRLRILTWISIAIAVAGLYFISVTKNFTISQGDLFELGGALFWACHILIIDRFSKKKDILKLSIIQFSTCAIMSFAVSAVFEHVILHNILEAAVPLAYSGICSVGIAYTLQSLGQKHSKPSHSAIILSMESVFSGIGGAIILGENMGLRGYFGCALMIAGMILSSVGSFKIKGTKAETDKQPQEQKA
jgi:drug/metabolite transporter (DMT)-like permease